MSSSCFFSLGNHISRMVTDNKAQSASNWMDEELLKRSTSLLCGTIDTTEWRRSERHDKNMTFTGARTKFNHRRHSPARTSKLQISSALRPKRHAQDCSSPSNHHPQTLIQATPPNINININNNQKTIRPVRTPPRQRSHHVVRTPQARNGIFPQHVLGPAVQVG